jgi:excisionase family DNA binding protein
MTGDAKQPVATPWLTVEEMAHYMKCGKKAVYGAAARGLLRVARIGGRRDIRGKAEWCDTYLESTCTPHETTR